MSVKGKVFTGEMSSKELENQKYSLRDELFYATVAKIGSGHIGIHTTQKKFAMVNEDLAIGGGTNNIITIPAHGLKEGYLIRFKTTALPINVDETTVFKIIDEDTIQISSFLNNTLTAGDVITVMRPMFERVAEDGSSMATVESGPMSFIKNGVKTTVTKDTNPSITAAIPVEIVGASGQEMQFNIEGDAIANVNDSGTNFSSIRIGDGTGKYVAITSDNEAKVNDEKNGLKLDTIATAVGDLATSGLATEAKQDAVISALTGISTEAKQDAAIAILSDLSTEAKQDLILTALGLQATSAKQDTLITEVSGLPTSGLATNTKLEELKTAIAAIGTGLATEATLLPINLMLTDSVTPVEIASDSSSGRMIDFLARIAKNITTMAAKLPATLGQKLMAQSLSVTIASNQTPVMIEKAPASSGFQNKGTLVDGAVTSINPPSGALGCIVRNKGSSAGTLHWEISATNATAGSFDLIPLTSTVFLECNASVHLFANEGDVDYVVQWLVK